MSIVNFDFMPVSIDKKDILLKILEYNKSISCEFSIGNLLTWNKVENTEYFICDDIGSNILYLRNKPNGNTNYYFPVSIWHNDNEIIAAVNNLYNFHVYNCKGNADENDFVLINLSAEQADFMKKYYSDKFGGITVASDRNHSEYIYEADKLRTFSGKKLHGKKNHLNKFYSLYGNSFRYEPICDHNIQECIKLSCEWSKINKYYLNNSMIEELDIVQEYFENYSKLDLLGGCIFINNEIKGFTIGEAAFPGSDTVVIHVEKAMYDIEGIYPALASLFLTENKQFKYVNREDDLGDEGLRKSKMSYRPLYLLDKYTVVITDLLK